MVVVTRPCPRFPSQNLDGKEGVDGSSPSEGSAKAPETGLSRFLVQIELAFVARAVGVEHVVEQSVWKAFASPCRKTQKRSLRVSRTDNCNR